MSANQAPKNNVFYRNQNWHYPKIDHGKGVYLYDTDGKEYIDGCSGSAVANIGHGNSEVAAFTKDHMERIAFTHLSRWTMESIEKAASKVAKWAPGDLNHVYFVSGGSEATESAIKLARQYYIERDGTSSKWKIISKWTSYHGNTLGALSMTGHTARRRIYDPLLKDFPKIPQFYHYRNPWELEDKYAMSVKAAQTLEKEILKVGPENIAGFISEPVVGSAAPGVHPDKIYFDLVRDICTKYDILLIIDEVMSGFGRTGKPFACDHFELIPDILVSAKGMSSGYTPLGCLVANDEIFTTVMIEGTGKFVHGHTYAGNPLSAGIGYKVMEIIEREKYIENARIQGSYLLDKLKTLYTLPMVGDIRGVGLMIGIEFVKDKKTKAAYPLKKNVKSKVMEACFKEGLIVYPGGGSVDGRLGDHILIAPPISITREEINLLFKKLKTALVKVSKEI